MVGLSYLKHSYNLSDEQVCERWVENPYWQFFCGFDYLQHSLPIEPSSLTRWREGIGASGMERLLATTVEAALASAAVRPSSLERVTVDTTVQPKAIAFPLDSRLYDRGREILVRVAVKHGSSCDRAVIAWASERGAWPIAMRTRGRCGGRDGRSGD